MPLKQLMVYNNIQSSRRPFRILMADDDFEDIEFTKLFFAQNGLSVEVNDVENGQLLMDTLREKKNDLPDSQLPQLILLDVNMPTKDGFETLKEIKEDLKLCRIPVVIMSTSNSKKHIDKAYELGANCYITKPKTAEDWSRTMGNLGRFWIQCASWSI